ncbi:hypothetical protein [uncultured Draconibacterium sp.]|uniref:hypothetical protein n=1 Tax=uncultured Draconibacterium sp. TaxID=1573823 RepID=UPI002AA64F0F|nr:hypothetical protein [uncultured Draconibacterium sp.]
MEIKLVQSLLLVLVVLSIGLVSWIFKDKNEVAVFKKLKLFPRWFKFLGLVIVICGVSLPWIFQSLLVDGSNHLGIIYIIFGLFLICFSRDKIEDEMSNTIRLKSFYRSFGAGVVGFFFLTWMENSVSENFSQLPADTLLAVILGFYLVSYYVTKSKIRSAE